MATINDDVILQKIKFDLNSGFELLLKHYQKPVYYHIRQLVLDHDDAADITQEVFIKVYKNIDKFKGESKLYTWLYRIATNESINFLNKKARNRNLSLDDLVVEVSQNLSADAFFDADEATLQLEKAVASLPEKQRLVFQMKYFEELKYEEISEILETSVGALKANYHHATKKIEEILGLNLNP